jgi:hypothetical protein
VFSVLAGRKKEWIAFAALFAVLGAFAFALFSRIEPAVLFMVLAGSSLSFAGLLARRVGREDGFVIAWFILALGIVALIEPWVSGRYFLLILPPAAILFSRMAEQAGTDRVRKIMVGGAAAATLLMGISSLIADYVWARSYPRISQQFAEKNYTPGYFAGHFGFQYYMEKAGFVPLEVNATAPEKGYVIIARIPDPQMPGREWLRRMERVGGIASESGFPVRLMSFNDQAGFYSSFWGIFPFFFSSTPVDEYAVYRLKALGRTGDNTATKGRDLDGLER